MLSLRQSWGGPFHSTVVGYASRKNLDIEKVYEASLATKDNFVTPCLTIFLNINEDIQKKRIDAIGLSKNSKSDYKCLEDDTYRERLFKNYKYISEKESWYTIDTSTILISEVVDECIIVINNYKQIIGG